jgi:D-glycero-alpha-D-manno-heptose-7-phosphate kinase
MESRLNLRTAARAPVRISLAGGGTDFEAFYSKFGGIVVSVTINRFARAIPTPSGIIESYYWQDGQLWRQKDLAWLRNVAKLLGISGVCIISDVPPGTGLGSSGSVVVAMIKSQHSDYSTEEIAELACHIEIDLMGMPIGKQDQYAASYGGFNIIRFSRMGITVTPIAIPAHRIKILEQRMMLFFVGNSRDSSSILGAQKQALELGDAHTVRVLQSIGHLGRDIHSALQMGNLDEFGLLLDCYWQQKRTLTAGITNPTIDGYYMAALAAGAIGGKLSGAGGGGFLMLYCHEEHQRRVIESLEMMGARHMPFKFEMTGARLI